MLTEEELRHMAESAAEMIRPSGLAVVNRLVLLALMEMTGERGAAILFGAGRLLSRELGDLESTLATFADLTGCDVNVEDDVVIVRNCPECAGHPDTRGPTRHFMRGLIAGAHELETGERAPVEGLRCLTTGGNACEFRIGRKPLS